MMNRKEQLGIDPATASYRLIKDLLFDFIIKAGHVCFRCGKELTRNSFSVDHKIPWLNATTARDLFFNLENIAYSHKSCNYGAARKPQRKYFFNSKEE